MAETNNGKKEGKLNPAKVGVPMRNVQITPDDGAARYFAYNNSAVGTTLMAVLSSIFPPGEAFFVESVKRFRDQVTDEAFKARVTGFIGQEAMHTREHDRLNKWFESRGFDMSVPDATIRFSLWICEQFSPTQQLAMTAFMEHFTAHLAEQWLTHKEFRNSTEAEMLKLWTWHGIEELEHKDVSYDVLQLVSKNDHLERLIAMPVVILALAPSIAFSWMYLMVREGKFFDVVRNAQDLWALFKPDGFITQCVKLFPDFLKKDFHPNERDTSVLLKRYTNEYFTPNGTLKNEFKNREAIERAAS